MPSNRMLRVNELMKRELGCLCEREIAPTPGTLLTVTEVRTAPDLRQAVVFVSVLGDDKAQQQSFEALRRKRTLLQRELAHRVQLKYTPVLKFELDQTLRRADRVLAIMDELHLQDATPTDPEQPDPPVHGSQTVNGELTSRNNAHA